MLEKLRIGNLKEEDVAAAAELTEEAKGAFANEPKRHKVQIVGYVFRNSSFTLIVCK